MLLTTLPMVAQQLEAEEPADREQVSRYFVTLFDVVFQGSFVGIQLNR